MENNNGKGLSIAGLVLGIVAVFLSFFYMVNILGLILAIVGLVCAVKGSKAAKAAGEPTGMATAGLVLSIIGLVFAGIGVLACTVCVSCAACAFGNSVDELNELVNEISSMQ